MKSDSLLMFLAGVGIGAAAAVLLAPYPGTETRQRIREGASQAGDHLKEHAEKLSNAAQSVVAKGKRTWADTEERGSQAVDELQGKVERKIDQVADRSRSVAHDAGVKMEQGGRRLQDA